ncbi:MAG: hypothetical protein MUE60_00540 [Candidatus Eisenbacteria bacterium]|jgi:hypothetical protein|nr:hypothetical protein [Candidatus Eisenbacteria bacterium]
MRHVAILLLLALVAGGVRIWKIDQAPFGDPDDIRDWARARNVALGREPWWLGPDAAITTGEGARLPGGLYYLLLAGAYELHPRPLSGLLLTAGLSTLAAVATFFLARLFMRPSASFLASLLAATSPVWVLAGRRIWNPDLLPVFSVAFFLSLSLWLLRASRFGLLISLAMAGIALQLHLSGLALLPLAAVAVAVGRKRPKALLLGLVLLAAPLAPFFVNDASRDWLRTRRLAEVLQRVVTPGEPAQENQGLPAPICWPLPYLPPLSTCNYGDDFLDRSAAARLAADSPALRQNGALAMYWKGPVQNITRSFRLQDLPERVRLHGADPPGMRVRFWADTAVSLMLLVLVLGGFSLLAADAVRGDRAASVLLLLTLPMLVCTRLRGVSDSYHFYLVFFPLPALIAARAVSGIGGVARIGRIALAAACLVNLALLVDRARDLESLGGTPAYGVGYRHRAEAAKWLLAAGCAGRDDLVVTGERYVWDYLLPRGGGGRTYRVLELGESTLHAVCRTTQDSCGSQWLAVRERLSPRLAHQSGGVWIYHSPPNDTLLVLP